VTGDLLEIRMRDWGSGVVPPPAPMDDPDPLRPGGLGLICLARKMDHVVFEPQHDGMLLRLGKRLNGDADAKRSGTMIQLRNSTDLVSSARQEGDAILVGLRGEIDLHNSPQLRAALFELLERPGVKKLILNVGQVPYVDSSAIAVLVEAIRKLRETQGKLYLTQLQPRVQSVMEVTRLGSLIGLAESDAAALAM
ncbi:MAG TPA: STAS domain-containing protein, partial [Tepidisphaeraceae bacterium]|nr:STAS domain-containing protein [Tepidisphaeraceae bacterium]